LDNKDTKLNLEIDRKTKKDRDSFYETMASLAVE